MTKTIGITILVTLTLFLCYLMSQDIRIGCEEAPLKEVGLMVGEPCSSQHIVETRYKLVNVFPATKLLIISSVPLSLIAIGTFLVIRAIRKAK